MTMAAETERLTERVNAAETERLTERVNVENGGLMTVWVCVCSSVNSHQVLS